MSKEFDRLLARALKAKDPLVRLRKLRNASLKRLEEIQMVGWPALAASWEADVQRVEQLIRERK